MITPRDKACRLCHAVNQAIARAHEWMCRKVCGHITLDERALVPQQIRDASHNLANAATALQSNAMRIPRQTADVLDELASAMRDRENSK